MIHTLKAFSVVSEAEVDVFLEFPCFFDDPAAAAAKSLQLCLTMCSPIDYSPREGNGTPLQYSCLGNPMKRGAWQALVPGVPKSLI